MATYDEAIRGLPVPQRELSSPKAPKPLSLFPYSLLGFFSAWILIMNVMCLLYEEEAFSCFVILQQTPDIILTAFDSQVRKGRP